MTTSPPLRFLPSVPDEGPRFGVVTQATVRGPQTTAVRTLHPVTGNTTPQIAVRVGPILVLVVDHAALDSFVSAWRQAQEMADVAFREGGHSQ